jgi:hypothetical protein
VVVVTPGAAVVVVTPGAAVVDVVVVVAFAQAIFADDDVTFEIVSLLGHVTVHVAPADIDFVEVLASALTANNRAGSTSRRGQSLRVTACSRRQVPATCRRDLGKP